MGEGEVSPSLQPGASATHSSGLQTPARNAWAYPAHPLFSAEIAIACSYPNFSDHWRFRMLFAIDNSFRNALEPSVTISTTRLKWSAKFQRYYDFFLRNCSNLNKNACLIS